MRVQSNVLVDDTGHARITDFGLVMIAQDLDLVRALSDGRDHTGRWIAPEILSGGSHSKEGDVFSFAMVMIEVRHGGLFSSSLSLPPSRMATGIHRCYTFQSRPTCSGHTCYNEGNAPPTTNPPTVHEWPMGIDAKLLELGPPLAPRGFRDIRGPEVHVSLLALACTLVDLIDGESGNPIRAYFHLILVRRLTSSRVGTELPENAPRAQPLQCGQSGKFLPALCLDVR